MDLENSCRLCLQNNNTLLCVFSESLVDIDIHGKIGKYLYLDIKENDYASKSICLDCLKRLKEIHNFFIEVEQNQLKIAELQTTSLRYEIITDEVNYDDSKADANMIITEEVNYDDSEADPNIQPIQSYEMDIDLKSGSFSTTPLIDKFEYSNAIIIENPLPSSPQYEIMVIPMPATAPSPQPSDVAEQKTDIIDELENFDNSSVASSNDNDDDEDDDDVTDDFDSDEFPPNIDGYPKVFIEDFKLVIKGEELFELMSKFYKLQCDVCQEGDNSFAELSSLLEHYEAMHSVKGYVKCCDKKLLKPRAMALHMARHIQPDAFKCPECGKMMTCPKILRYHIQNHLPEEQRPLPCPDCPRRFSYSSALAAHSISHLPEDERDTHVCDECGKTYKLASRLAIHIGLAHSSSVPRYVCHECGKQFTTSGNLGYHLTTHEQIHQVQCTVCQKWLKNKYCLRKHMWQHSGSRFQCSSCNYTAVNLQCLRNHISVHHTSEKAHVCPECGRSFKLKSTLSAHMVQHTGERKFVCEFCKKRFASSGNYYSHRKKMHPDQLAELNQKREEEKKKGRELARKLAKPKT